MALVEHSNPDPTTYYLTINWIVCMGPAPHRVEGRSLRPAEHFLREQGSADAPAGERMTVLTPPAPGTF